MVFLQPDGDGPGEDEDDRRSNGSGQIGVDAFDADLGQQSSSGGEDGGQQCPK